jgi:hypothetical protein
MTRLGACLLTGLWTTVAFAQATPDDPPPNEQPPASPPNRGTGSERPTQELPPTAQLPAVKLLNARLPLVEFDEAPLADVLARLREISGANVVVRWTALEDAGVRRDTPISINVRNLRLSQVLWLVLNESDIAGAELAYRADRDMILISTVDDIGRVMITRVYDVRDLAAPKLRRPGITIGRFREVPIGSTVSVAGGAVAVRPVTGSFGSGVFLQGSDFRRDDDEYDEDPEDLLQKLIEVITTSIEPESWAVNGGPGTIGFYRGTLVIRNTPLVHQRIAGALFEPDAP